MPLILPYARRMPNLMPTSIPNQCSRCYTEAVRPSLARALLAPVRAIYEYSGVSVGASAFERGQKSLLWRSLPDAITRAMRAPD